MSNDKAITSAVSDKMSTTPVSQYATVDLKYLSIEQDVFSVINSM